MYIKIYLKMFIKICTICVHIPLYLSETCGFPMR